RRAGVGSLGLVLLRLLRLGLGCGLRCARAGRGLGRLGLSRLLLGSLLLGLGGARRIGRLALGRAVALGGGGGFLLRRRLRVLLLRLVDIGAPAHGRGGGAGMLVEQNEVQIELAAHILLADVVLLDALLCRPGRDVLVEQALGVTRGALLAVVVDREAHALAAGK